MPKLDTKDIDIENFSRSALENKQFLSEVLNGLVEKNENIRYNSSKILNYISENNPDIIYPKFDYFTELLESKNSYHICSAIEIIANLTDADPEEKFEKIFDKFFDIFQNNKTIPTAYLARSSGKIALSKPKLQNKIIQILLNIEKLHKGKQIELIKSHIIESLSKFFKNIEEKEEIISFVKNQLKSTSPKTRKAAQNFIKKYQV